LNTQDLGITDGIIDTSFFDQFGDIINESTGGISWNEIKDFDQYLAQYQKYKDEVVPAIKKKQSEV
jgi:hypothetical protein